MAKKVRRVRRRSAPPELPEAPPTADAPHQPTEEALREEYAYVMQDLRRVFLLAAIMFLLLIILNLFL